MGGDRRTPTGAYVVGIDHSIAALNAARWIAGEACRAGAPVRLVHAYRDTAAAQRRDVSGRALVHFASSARLLVLGGTGQHLIHHAAGPIAVVRCDIPT